MTDSIERFGKSLREQQLGLCEEWRRVRLAPSELLLELLEPLEPWEEEVKGFTGTDPLSGDAWARLQDWYKSRTRTHEIATKLELAQIQAERRGFIVNARTDGYKLHRAGCDSVGAMHPGAYPKIFFKEFDDADALLKTKSADAWSYCGYCSPQQRRSP